MAARKAKGRAQGTPTPHDLIFKQFLTHPETARDFMQLHLPAELQTICDFSTLRLESGSFVEESLRPYFSDVLYSLSTAPGVMVIFTYSSNTSRPRTNIWRSGFFVTLLPPCNATWMQDIKSCRW